MRTTFIVFTTAFLLVVILIAMTSSSTSTGAQPIVRPLCKTIECIIEQDKENK